MLHSGEFAMIDQLISSVKPQIVATLGSRLGLSPQAAEEFLGKALPLLSGYLTSGKIDAAAIISAIAGAAAGGTGGAGAGGGGAAGLQALLQGFDARPLASLVGGDVAKAQAGVGAIAAPLLAQVKNAGNSQELIGQLLGGDAKGGAGAGLGGLLGSIAGGLLGGKR